MKHRTARLVLSIPLFLFLLAGVSAQAETLSVPQYRQQLRDITAQIDSLKDHPEDAGQVLTGIPDQVSLTFDDREQTVSYKDLKDDLAEFPKADEQKRAALLQQLHTYLQTLDREAESYQHGTADPAPERSKMNEILARREFRKVAGASAMDVLKAKLAQWLLRVLRFIFRRGSSTLVSNIFVYVVVGAVSLALIIWVVKRLTRPPQEEVGPREIIPFAPSSKSWRTWLAEARALAAQQDWRNGIHLAYWAGISFLEENGAWKPNRARTPREYLRLLGSGNYRHQYTPLSDLTRKFEIVWYGHRSAGKDDFLEILVQLAKLGCQ